jgi:hypothetical protein
MLQNEDANKRIYLGDTLPTCRATIGCSKFCRMIRYDAAVSNLPSNKHSYQQKGYNNKRGDTNVYQVMANLKEIFRSANNREEILPERNFRLAGTVSNSLQEFKLLNKSYNSWQKRIWNET